MAGKDGTTDKELEDFLFAKAGGREKVLLEFYQEKVKQAVSSEQSLGELIKTATEKGWSEVLLAFKLKDLGRILIGGGGASGIARKGSERKESLLRITDYLKQKGSAGASQKELKSALGLSGSIISQKVSYLQKTGNVRASGERKKKTYYYSESK